MDRSGKFAEVAMERPGRMDLAGLSDLRLSFCGVSPDRRFRVRAMGRDRGTAGSTSAPFITPRASRTSFSDTTIYMIFRVKRIEKKNFYRR